MNRVVAASPFLAATTLAGIVSLHAAPASSPLELDVAIVNDPDFPPIERAFVLRALEIASRELRARFGVDPPRFALTEEVDLASFLGRYADPADPRCSAMYAARYKGGGAEELLAHHDAARAFFERWPLDALRGFADEAGRPLARSHEDVYTSYVAKYVKTVDRLRGLKTPLGLPLVDPVHSSLRSFVAWTCALMRQPKHDIILTNTFILADLATEPHPHAVFGKAKIGGIAGRSPARTALGGQALLATTFGIDTPIEDLAELPGASATEDERAKILGLYLLAHEIAHAIFGIPDVFDHPAGCVMSSRPGANYRDGLTELERHRRPCPRCWAYVEAKIALDDAARRLDQGLMTEALERATRAANLVPKHFHGGRKRRIAQALIIASKASRALGKSRESRAYAEAARTLDPASVEVLQLFEPLATAPAWTGIEPTTTSTQAAAP